MANREFSVFLPSGRGSRLHVMLHDRKGMLAPEFTLSVTSNDGLTTMFHLTADRLLELHVVIGDALAALADPSEPSADIGIPAMEDR